jgi:hypothetical protein
MAYLFSIGSGFLSYPVAMLYIEKGELVMNKPIAALLITLVVSPTLTTAGSLTSDAVVGGALGGALGAFVGSEIDGRSGAILGGALGGAAGTAITTSNYRDRGRVQHHHYYNHRDYNHRGQPRYRHRHSHYYDD